MKVIDAKTRVQLKNILFTTDFSSAANAALPYAADIARSYGAKLHLAHVYNPNLPGIYGMEPPTGWGAVRDSAEEYAREQAERLLEDLQGIEREVRIESGDIWAVLEEMIEESKIDLIVLGTRGRTGLGKFLLGSVAETIFRKAPCPVLTVGPHSPAGPGLKGGFRRILLATAFNPASAAATPYAVSLAQENDADLILLHVIEEPKPEELVQPAQLISAAQRLLQQLVPEDAEFWCKPEFLVEEGAPAEKILEIAKRKKADLIVLGVHPPRGPAGADTHLPMTTAHKVVSHAPCPVLTVRG